MTGILSSIQNLVQSILGIFKSLLDTALSGIQGVFALVGTLIANVANLARGLVELVLGNIVVIGIVIAGLVGWSAYQQRRGQVSSGSAIRAKKKA